MRIIIVAWSHEFPFVVGEQEPVVSIKRKIEQVLGVPVEAQSLAMYGWELVDGLDMEDYPVVTEGTRIDLTINTIAYPFSKQSNKIKVVVKFSARHVIVEVDKTDTVGSLKEKIHIVDGTPIKRLSLFFCGVELEDDFRNVCEYGVHEFCEIVVFLKSMTRVRSEPPTKKLNIAVQTPSCLLDSAIIPFEMKDSCTVSELKQLLLTRKILPLHDYLFIHKQRIMRDNCSLRWHGVQNGDSLYVFRGTVTRGGF